MNANKNKKNSNNNSKSKNLKKLELKMKKLNKKKKKKNDLLYNYHSKSDIDNPDSIPDALVKSKLKTRFNLPLIFLNSSPNGVSAFISLFYLIRFSFNSLFGG